MALREDSAAEAGADDEHVIPIQHQRGLLLLLDRTDAPEREEGDESGEHAEEVRELHSRPPPVYYYIQPQAPLLGATRRRLGTYYSSATAESLSEHYDYIQSPR